MVVLDTICHETIWGGPRIAKFANVEGNKIGHLYSVFCRDNVSNCVLNGIWKGQTLNEIFPLWKADFQMERYTYFPLTIALTEADDNLSIQVHPDDVVANAVEHMARGKRESWYFLEAPQNGYIYNGCVCRDDEECDRFLQEKRFLEMTDKLPVHAGDYVFVEPGTLHSITAGSLVYEIEEGSDCTYRFFDFDRVDVDGKQRELHIAKASRALQIHKKSIVQHYHAIDWIEEETYATKKLEHVSTYQNNSTMLECFTLIQGRATCDGVDISPGMTVILWPNELICDANTQLAIVSKLKEKI